MNSILQEDLENIVKSDIPNLAFKNSTILVTGASGLIGSLIVKTLLQYNNLKNYNITIIGIVRDIKKANIIFTDYIRNEKLNIIVQDITKPLMINKTVDFIFHCASPTSSSYFVSKPVETILTSVLGTQNILEFAKNNSISNMIYLSSMEVYGSLNKENKKVTEEDLGYIDPLDIRSSYSEGKRICECLCASYAKEYKVPVKIARLAQTFGAGISLDDKRIFVQFIKAIIQKKDIILHTHGLSMGNYCYTTDMIKGLFYIITKGNIGEAYTIVNEENTMQIKDVAFLVAEKLASNEIKVIFDLSNQNYGYAPDTFVRLSADKLRNLGWSPTINLETMYLRTVKSLMEQMNENSKL